LFNKVEVVKEEITSLSIGSYDEIVLTSLEKPFGLSLFKQYSQLFDFIQLDHVAGRVRELALRMIRNEHTFDWVEVQEPRVVVYSHAVHFLNCAFDTSKWKQ